MSTRALTSPPAARIVRKDDPACPVAAILREVAQCRRLIQDHQICGRIRKLPRRDQSDATPQYMRKRVFRRIRAMETLAGELQSTSLVGAAYQLLLAMDLACMDDDISAAVDRQKAGAVDRLMDKTDTVQNTILSAYLALRAKVHDADLAIVERAHDIRGWKPNRTVTALLAEQVDRAES